MRAEVSLVTVGGPRAGAIGPALGDLAAAGHAARIEVRADETPGRGDGSAAEGPGEGSAAEGQRTARETGEGSGLYVVAEF